jgi:methyltransferase
MSPVWVAVGLVGAQRLAELMLAQRNTRRLLAAGAVERGLGHYPLIVALHAAWLGSLPLIVPGDRWPDAGLIGLFLGLQALRLWIIATLGRRWTTRVLIVPGEVPVRRGPYRWCRHPNYAVVAAEIPLLPLAFGAIAHALLFGLANLALLAWRIRVEDAAWEAGGVPGGARPPGHGQVVSGSAGSRPDR